MGQARIQHPPTRCKCPGERLLLSSFEYVLDSCEQVGDVELGGLLGDLQLAHFRPPPVEEAGLGKRVVAQVHTTAQQPQASPGRLREGRAGDLQHVKLAPQSCATH